MVGEIRDSETLETAIEPLSPATWCCRRCTGIKAIDLVRNGTTTIDEVIRVFHEL
jgi:type II secretory ATPase GspE/PulE/Tfp pilus assembly ATPase PilB-like protein